MEIKYTPGPWVISWNTFNSGESHGIYAEGELDLKGYQIAVVNWWPTLGNGNEQQGKANVKLISAAPDLLHAALLAYHKLSSGGSNNTAILKLLSDAIDKATK